MTVNVTAWSTFEETLRDDDYTGIEAIMIQEHKLLEDDFPRARRAAGLLGWRADFLPCRLTEAEGRSGGVGVLVRNDVI